MNPFPGVTYRVIKWYRQRYIPSYSNHEDCYDKTVIETSQMIIDKLLDQEPCMIARYGATEMDCYINYRKGHPLWWLRSIYPFWIGEGTKLSMKNLSGFFPIDDSSLVRFSQLMDDCGQQLDILASWLQQERHIPLLKNVPKIRLLWLEPYWSPCPWTKVLEGKNVLVVHPFAETILSQYKKRDLLFENKDVLPRFKSLTVIKAVQTIGGHSEEYATWFDALSAMEAQIKDCDFDIALIGCGAYGMPLAAFCKQLGKKAIHMGGALQLLFGIRGSRWESSNYNQEYDYTKLFNEHWVRPNDDERPENASQVEKACYW